MSLIGAVLSCLVIAVKDGDGLTARCALGERGVETVDLRVAAIDAPDRGQPFAERSEQHLEALCLWRRANATVMTVERSGPLVARVTCDGVDVGAEQVRAGMAWVSEEQALDGSLYRLQDAARGAGAGLWKDPSPLAPWEWRRAKRSRDVKVDVDSRLGRR